MLAAWAAPAEPTVPTGRLFPESAVATSADAEGTATLNFYSAPLVLAFKQGNVVILLIPKSLR